VIVEDPKTREIILMTKGADNVIEGIMDKTGEFKEKNEQTLAAT